MTVIVTVSGQNDMTVELSRQWQRLQNGSDIRGVALEGVAGESVNLTPEVAFLLGQAFVSWLADKLSKGADELVLSVGRDSRISGPALMAGLAEGRDGDGGKGV